MTGPKSVDTGLRNYPMTIAKNSDPGKIFPLARSEKTDKFRTTFNKTVLPWIHSPISNNFCLRCLVFRCVLYSLSISSSSRSPLTLANSSSSSYCEGSVMLEDLIRDFWSWLRTFCRSTTRLDRWKLAAPWVWYIFLTMKCKSLPRKIKCLHV
jgi:hypothetical protein